MNRICALFRPDGRGLPSSLLDGPLGALGHGEETARWHSEREASRAVLGQGGQGARCFAWAERHLAITADVRLDNRKELEDALAPGEGPALADGELILRAYAEWGEACCERLLGDFAFVLWDGKAGKLLAARDFIGTRPLYVVEREGLLGLASSLEAALAMPQASRRLDLDYLCHSLTRLHHQHPRATFHADIRKLPPAHALTATAQGCTLREYWRPEGLPEIRFAEESQYVDALEDLLEKAVACRLPEATVPVGVHLSGGLDSSALAVMVARRLARRGDVPTGFSWAPPPDGEWAEKDERRLVEAIRAQEGIPVEYTAPTPQDFADFHSTDRSLHPMETLLLERVATRRAEALGIRVMISGWGGDEFAAFNGRGYFPDLLRRGRWITLLREARQRRAIHGGPFWRNLVRGALLPLLPEGCWPFRPARAPRIPYPAILKPALGAHLRTFHPAASMSEAVGVRKQQIALLRNGHLAARMEAWANHGARHGMEYAYPLLDRRIVEFCLGLPDHLFFKQGWKRYLFRRATRDLLPPEVRWNKVKHEPALDQGMRSLRPEGMRLLRSALETRRSAMEATGILEGEALLAELDRESREAPPPSPSLGDITRFCWLAFLSPETRVEFRDPGQRTQPHG